MGHAASLCVLATVALAARGPTLRNISGLAPAGEGVVLAVADTKRGSDADRFALLSTADGSALALRVDWPADLATHDLEALCPVPGHPDQYLAFESGRADNGDDLGGGVAYRVWLDRAGNDGSTLRFLQRIVISPGLRAPLGAGEFDQVEGAVAWLSGDDVVVALGQRETGELLLLRLIGDSFELRDRLATSHLRCDRDRRIADLCVDARDGQRVLYGVQADDPGDFGPFGSTVVTLGTISAAGVFELAPEATVAAVCEGFKVEGLCVPASGDAGLLIAGTDDEGFAPALRALRLKQDSSRGDR